MLRRNTVVVPVRGGLFGRVVSVLPNGHCRVVCCGKHDQIVDPETIQEVDYDGRWRWGREPWNTNGKTAVFDYMPSLRKIKQMAGGYNPDVWRKPKRKLLRDNPHIPYEHAHEAWWHIRDAGVQYGKSSFAGRKFDDHNPYRRWEHLGCVATMYRAMHKAKSIRGDGWEIFVSNDYTDRVEVRYGDIGTILGDLAIIALSATPPRRY